MQQQFQTNPFGMGMAPMTNMSYQQNAFMTGMMNGGA
jgi:hypothetical protein